MRPAINMINYAYVIAAILLPQPIIGTDYAHLDLAANCRQGVQVLDGEFVGLIERYHQFRKRFGRQHERVDCQRLKVFGENERIAAKLTREDGGTAEYSALHSPYGDISQEEFRSSVLMQPRASESLDQIRPEESGFVASDVDAFDWREHGAVSDVRNQGSLGTCYLFSAAGNIEGQLAIHKKLSNVAVSVEHPLECDATKDVAHSEAVCGEFGGWPFLVFEFWKAGFVEEKELTYCAGTVDKKTKNPKCFPCMAKGYSKQFCGDHGDLFCNASTTKGQGPSGVCNSESWLKSKRLGMVRSWKRLSSNETVLKHQMATIGPLSTVMNASWLQFYRRGISNPLFCNPKSKTHAVLLVGFGVDKKQRSYWIVKNSWGPDWGEKGFFRMRMQNTCGLTDFVQTAILA